MLTIPSDVEATAPGDTPIATSELSLEGMHCNACATRIERALAKQPAVLSASVNLATNRAFVTYDTSAIGPADLCATVDETGYSASVLDRRAEGTPTSHGDHWELRAAISWPVALLALGVALLGPEDVLAGWIVLSLAVFVEFAGGWPFLRTAGRLLRHGATSMDTLIAVGTPTSMVMNENRIPAISDCPLTNRWCPQTRNPMTAIPMLEAATKLYPKMPLREKQGTSSLITPMPGRIMM